MKKFLSEFKTFITRGNVMDLAVAVIIGAAFKDIINSLVKDIFTPIISLVVGEKGFENYKYVITEANEAAGIAENAIYYGNFIQNVINFLAIALVIFVIIKVINKVAETVEEAKAKTIEAANNYSKEDRPKMEDILVDIKELLRRDEKKIDKINDKIDDKK